MPPPSQPPQARSWQTRFIAEHRLGDAYLQTAAQFFDPLGALLARVYQRRSSPLLIALNGCQGSGKTTLCDYLCEYLQAEHSLRVVALSLDDFYLTRAERQALASRVHPLFATRGVPGTHDLALLRATIDALRGSGGDVAIPRFDKAIDDRFATEHWSHVTAPVDVVLLEGWCLGARGEDEASLLRPINALERDEDSAGKWRAYSNRALDAAYVPLYADVDFWIMLAAPGFEQVLRWRSEQEGKLRSARGNSGEGLMDDAQLQRFVAHFERHTRQCFKQLPPAVDVLYTLNDARQIIAVRGLEPGQ